MARHIVIPPGSGQDYPWSLDHVFVKVPDAVTEGRVTLVEDTLKPGFLLSRHVHKKMVEIFYMLDGEVEFRFDDETVTVTTGTTVIVPALLWHEVASDAGAKLLTIFTPGGFDRCLAAMVKLPPEHANDAAAIAELEERFDIWRR